MRMLFITTDYSLPAEIDARYDDVDIVGVAAGYADGLDLARSTSTHAPIDVAVVASGILNERDAREGVDLDRTLMVMRNQNSAIRLIVTSTTSVSDIGVLAGAQCVLNVNGQGAANVAEMLNLAPRTEAATIVAVTGLQGGAGQTTTAVGVTAELALRARRLRRADDVRRDVILWEIDPLHRSIAHDVKFRPELLDRGYATWQRLIDTPLSMAGDSMDALDPSIVRTTDSGYGYDLLLAPARLDDVMTVFTQDLRLDDLAEQQRRILAALRRHYRFVVLDMGSDWLWTPNAQFLTLSDVRLAVATPSASGIRSVRDLRSVLAALPDGFANTHLIINKHGADPDAIYETYLDKAATDTNRRLLFASKSVLVEGANSESHKVWHEIVQKVFGGEGDQKSSKKVAA